MPFSLFSAAVTGGTYRRFPPTIAQSATIVRPHGAVSYLGERVAAMTRKTDPQDAPSLLMTIPRPRHLGGV